MSVFLPAAAAICARNPRWSAGGQIPDAGTWLWGCRHRMALSVVPSWSGQAFAQIKRAARRGAAHQARRERAGPSWNDHFVSLNLFALKMAPVLHHPRKTRGFRFRGFTSLRGGSKPDLSPNWREKISLTSDLDQSRGAGRRRHGGGGLSPLRGSRGRPGGPAGCGAAGAAGGTGAV